MKRAWTALFLIAMSLWLVTGCASVRLVDTDVTAFSKWTAAPPGPGTTYRFERLPSQQNLAAQQDAVEAQARSALAKVGMELNPAVARYSVQVVATTQIIERGYPGYDGIFGGPGLFLGGGNRGLGFGLSFPMRFPEPTYFKRELSMLMRELISQQVVFETRAFHDGVWSDTQAVFPAMMDAALRGFPEPPPGTRRINVEIPR